MGQPRKSGRGLDVAIVAVMIVAAVGASWGLVDALAPDTSEAQATNALDIAQRLDDLAITSLHLLPELREPEDSLDEILEDLEDEASLVREVTRERSVTGVDVEQVTALADEARLLGDLDAVSYSDVRALARELQGAADLALLTIDSDTAAQVRSVRSTALSALWLVANSLATGAEVDESAYSNALGSLHERLGELDALAAGEIPEPDELVEPTYESFDVLHELVMSLDDASAADVSSSARPGLVGPAAGITLVVVSAAWLLLRRRATAKERELVNQRVRFLAAHDELTGLLNRGALLDAHELLAPTTGAAVLIVDLDGFKEVNDGHGHHAGDAVLRTVASRLRTAVRDIDVVARFGGDEFVVMLPHTRDPEQVGAVAERIIAAIIQPVLFEGTSLSVGSSVGAAFIGTDGIVSAIRDADASLYQAKRSGRGRVVMHPLMPDFALSDAAGGS